MSIDFPEQWEGREDTVLVRGEPATRVYELVPFKSYLIVDGLWDAVLIPERFGDVPELAGAVLYTPKAQRSDGSEYAFILCPMAPDIALRATGDLWRLLFLRDAEDIPQRAELLSTVHLLEDEIEVGTEAGGQRYALPAGAGWYALYSARREKDLIIVSVDEPVVEDESRWDRWENLAL